MNPEVKQMWIDALRSGEYKQGRESLQKNDRFCCLGVLCDLAEKNKQPILKDSVDGITFFDGECEFLPKAVMRWAGFRNDDPKVWYDERNTSLAIINDTHRESFLEIASLIEVNL